MENNNPSPPGQEDAQVIKYDPKPARSLLKFATCKKCGNYTIALLGLIGLLLCITAYAVWTHNDPCSECAACNLQGGDCMTCETLFDQYYSLQQSVNTKSISKES